MEEYKELVKTLGFKPKHGTTYIHYKEYTSGYTIEVDFEKQRINYGDGIRFDNENTQNFSQVENFVVLECVNRLLEKGYKPENIVLEKTYPTGHGTSGRLDILVKKENDEPYIMIECKTYGKEFEKELTNLKKDGGQLFTYFQQDKKTELLMLYASNLKESSETKIIKIDDKLRHAGNVQETHKLWDGEFYNRGFWENPPYDFKPTKFTKKDLRELTETEGHALFNKFATILRKHSVSDKPNAFNKIFNLFLAKLYDEQKREDDELEFHWREDDNPVDFQVRLFNLHTKGLYAFLEKELDGIYDKDFTGYKTKEELLEKKKKVLKINKIYDIKEVFDNKTFEQNHRVLKEVVELLEQYQIRYPRKQRYLSEFFEQLLTTGLKQEVGQYFTPPVITKFIVKSLPLTELLIKEINQPTPSLPATIDFAAGSGHFLTEVLEEYQDIIEKINVSDFYPEAKKRVASWKDDPYNWAARYVYGIEKDYRLVKVAKVGCYFYGDGLAQVILGDGLDSFEKSESYVGLLKENAKKPQFSILVSNPPYSVDGVKDDIEYIGVEDEFTLFKYLTYNSSEIEALFVERTKQLLKEGGIAGIILPSSILSNEGIYTKTREIIVKYFKIVAITELGSNTFMATGTNTVVLFLERRNNDEHKKIADSIEKSLEVYKDNNIYEIERPIEKYLKHVWGNISFNDYTTLIKKEPNDKIANHEIYKEYCKKIKAKDERSLWDIIIEIEKEKILYFILVYHQKVVVVITGIKDAEKKFLGYEFSNRRGKEGIHSIQRGKAIDECTKLFDSEISDNPEKASSYIYKAFSTHKGPNDKLSKIHESLKDNVSYVDLINMIAFDRPRFEKIINTNAKRKVKFYTEYDSVVLDDLVSFQNGLWRGEKGDLQVVKVLRNTNFKLNNGKLSYNEVAEIEVEKKQLVDRTLKYGDIILEKSGGSDTQAIGRVVLFDKKDNEIYSFSNFCSRIRVKDETVLNPIYLWSVLNDFYNKGGTIPLQKGVRLLNIDFAGYSSIKIPLPPLDIQKKIVEEIKKLEEKENGAKETIENGKDEIKNKIATVSKYEQILFTNTIKKIEGSTEKIKMSNIKKSGKYPVITQEKGKLISGYSDNTNPITDLPVLLFGDHSCSLKYLDFKFFRGADGTVLLKPQDCFIPKYFYNVLQYQLLDIIEAKDKYERHYKYLQNLYVPLPPLAEQKKIVQEIEKIEAEISKAQKIIDDMPEQKKRVLEKHGIE